MSRTAIETPTDTRPKLRSAVHRRARAGAGLALARLAAARELASSMAIQAGQIDADVRPGRTRQQGRHHAGRLAGRHRQVIIATPRTTCTTPLSPGCCGGDFLRQMSEVAARRSRARRRSAPTPAQRANDRTAANKLGVV